MSSSPRIRARQMSAALALLTLLVAGCSGQTDAEKAVDDAQDFMSNAKTCADLAKLAASNLDDIRSNMNDPARLEQTLRQAAADLEAEAAEADDAQMKKAINGYVTKLQQVAGRAERGQDVDLGAIREANGALTDACS